jgi:hypothetical protein
MALQLGALRNALIDGAAKPEKAHKAAEAMASCEGKLAIMDTKLTLSTWMISFNLVLAVGVLWHLMSR